MFASRPSFCMTLLVASVVCVGTASSASAQAWVELGPAPVNANDDLYVGRISALVCSPTDADLYFAGAADGGVWRTIDGGVSWTPLTDFMPTTAIGALVLDPTNENIIYAGTGEANYANHCRFGLGIFKSVDGGDTWSQIAEDTFAGRCFSRILIDPVNPLRMYASITRAGGFPELAAAKGHPQAEGPVGVFRSDDAGETWTHLTNGLPTLSATDLAMDPVNSGTLYAGIGRIFGDLDNGIYKTVDGGNSWTRINHDQLPGDWENMGRISVSVAPGDPNRVYTLIAKKANETGGGAGTKGAYRSDDGGATWTNMYVHMLLQASYGWYLSVVSVQPDDPNVVFMGGVPLRRTMTGGASWGNKTPPHVDMHALAWDADGRLVAGDDGGVHRSDDLGDSWTALNTGLGTLQFYAGLSTHPTDEEVLLGGNQDNGSNMRAQDSLEWVQLYGGDGGWTQIDQNDPLRLFVEYQGTRNIYRSVDGGASFTSSKTGIDGMDRNCFLPPYLIDHTDSAHMFFATHRLYESVNGGDSWTAISDDLTDGAGAIRAIAIAPTDPNTIYVATNDGNVQASFDGGRNFTLIADDVPGWPRVTREIFVDPTDALTMYLAVAQFGETQIRRTRDGGQTWEALDQNLPDVPINVVAVDVRGPVPWIYAGAEAGLYRSYNNGATWERYGEGLPNAVVIDLRLEVDRARLIASVQGRGVWRIDVSEPVPGDLTGDGAVGLADLIVLLSDFLCEDAPCVGDANGDGVTDLGDLATLLANYGYAP